MKVSYRIYLKMTMNDGTKMKLITGEELAKDNASNESVLAEKKLSV